MDNTPHKYGSYNMALVYRMLRNAEYLIIHDIVNSTIELPYTTGLLYLRLNTTNITDFDNLPVSIIYCSIDMDAIVMPVIDYLPPRIHNLYIPNGGIINIPYLDNIGYKIVTINSVYGWA
jgi:hypothetical protein